MKKYLGLFAIVAALLIFTWCGKNTVDIDDYEANEQNETATISDCKKWCDMLTNTTISKEDCYNLCKTSQQLESDDISDCDDIEETSGNFVTKDVCIQDKAIQAKNPEYCEKIENEMSKDTCYMGLASEMDDKEICENIQNNTIKSICLTSDENSEEE